MSLKKCSPIRSKLQTLPAHLILDIAGYMEVMWIKSRPYVQASIIPLLSKEWRWLYNYRIAVLVRRGGVPICHYLNFRNQLDGPTYRFNWHYRLTGYAFYREGTIVSDHKFEFRYNHDKWFIRYNDIFYYPPDSFFYSEEDDDPERVQANCLLQLKLFALDLPTFDWIKNQGKPWHVAEDRYIEVDDSDDEYDSDVALEERTNRDGVIVCNNQLLRRLQTFASLSGLKIPFPVHNLERVERPLTLMGNE